MRGAVQVVCEVVLLLLYVLQSDTRQEASDTDGDRGYGSGAARDADDGRLPGRPRQRRRARRRRGGRRLRGEPAGDAATASTGTARQ